LHFAFEARLDNPDQKAEEALEICEPAGNVSTVRPDLMLKSNKSRCSDSFDAVS
jgi:hypothetical protein